MKDVLNNTRAYLRTFKEGVGNLLLGEPKPLQQPSPSDFSLHKQAGVYSFLPYELHREALLDLKRNKESPLLEPLATELGKELVNLRELYRIDADEEILLVPIPLSRLRFLRRGFNQSLVLLKTLQRLNPVEPLRLETRNLVKIRETPRQATLTRRQRLTNLRDSFMVRKPERLKGKTIFVFDDISTTGTTLKEARRVLEEAGAKQVICISLAH